MRLIDDQMDRIFDVEFAPLVSAAGSPGAMVSLCDGTAMLQVGPAPAAPGARS